MLRNTIWIIVGHSFLMGILSVIVHIKQDARTGGADDSVLFYRLSAGRHFSRRGKFRIDFFRFQQFIFKRPYICIICGCNRNYKFHAAWDSDGQEGEEENQ